MSNEMRVRAKRMATSSAVKMVAAWGRDQRASNEEKTAEQSTPSSDLDPSVLTGTVEACVLEWSRAELRSSCGW